LQKENQKGLLWDSPKGKCVVVFDQSLRNLKTQIRVGKGKPKGLLWDSPKGKFLLSKKFVSPGNFHAQHVFRVGTGKFIFTFKKIPREFSCPTCIPRWNRKLFFII